jgi:pilus assembly protein Flp/PilA
METCELLPVSRAPGDQAGHFQHTALGQGLVEYALILAIVALVVIGVLTELGGKGSLVFSRVDCTLASSAAASSSSDHPGNPQGGGGGIGNNTTTTTTGGC